MRKNRISEGVKKAWLHKREESRRKTPSKYMDLSFSLSLDEF